MRSGPEADACVGSREALVALLAIAVATVLAYSNTFDASFHFDDSVFRSEGLRDLSKWSPSDPRWLGYLSFALNYQFGGLEVFGYHLTNLLIHICNALLVSWLVALTLQTPALRHAEASPLVRQYLPLFSGLLFALHPIATQAVTYIAQRFASLATLFFLLSLALYAQARLSLEADAPRRARAASLYCVSVFAAAAAMKTKEISFTLPFVAVAYELLFFRYGRRLLLLVPLGATALLVPFGIVQQHKSLADAIGAASHILAETQDIPRSVYLLTQSRVVLTYIRLLLLPIGQNLDYDFPLSHSLADPAVLFALAMLLAVVASAVHFLVRARKTNRAAGTLVFFGIAWFFVTLSVESSVIPIRDVINEHRVYLPSAGAFVALSTLLLEAVERLRLRASPALQVGMALLITAGPLGIATYSRNFVWKDDLTLWRDVVAKSPGKWRPHLNLGLAYLDRGAASEAESELLVALKIFPHANGHNILGLAYKAKGQVGQAVSEFREAIRIDRELVDAHINLGSAYIAERQLDEAVRELREAIRLAPERAEAHNNLGNALMEQGKLDEAIAAFEKGIALTRAHPDTGAALSQRLAEAHSNLGAAYEAKGQIEDAVRLYREAIRLSPAVAEAHNNLGLILAKQGRIAEAIEEFRRALALKPLPDIDLNLAGALEVAGRSAEAIAQYERFLNEAEDKYPGRAEMVRDRIARLRASSSSR